MKLAIASGKGGTGKTTVSASLISVWEEPVVAVDLDVEEPNLHLFLKPEITGTRKAMMAVFSEMGQASEAVAAIIANRVVPATLEFMDNFTIRAVESYSQAGLPLDAGALMLVECDGYPGQVEEDAAKVESIAIRTAVAR